MNTKVSEVSFPGVDQSTLTEGLVSLIRGKVMNRPDYDAMALLTLDGIANMFAGRNSVPGQMFLRYLEGKEGDAGRRALVSGALMHILEVDDLHKASVLHPACVTIPVALALGAKRGLSGHAFLGALIAGYEACTRIGMSVGKAHYKTWHNTGTLGTFGGAMTAAVLMELSDGEIVHALGNAGTQSAGLWEFLNSGAMSKHLHAGRAAEAGLVSAELAKLGVTGPPAILEGKQGLYAGACPDPHPGEVLRDPDAPWQVHATSIKPWPSCRHTHPVIDAALELSDRIDIDSVNSIQVVTYQASVDVCNRPRPQTEYEAKFSLQHCVAIALMDGSCVFDSFSGAARDRASALAGKVRVRAGDPYNTAYPTAWGGEVTVQLADNSVITAARANCKGDPDAALSRDEMVGKAEKLLSYGGIRNPERMIQEVLDMANDGPVPASCLSVEQV